MGRFVLGLMVVLTIVGCIVVGWRRGGQPRKSRPAERGSVLFDIFNLFT